MKTLKDFLETIDNDRIVSIGTQEGSGYFYIAEAGEEDQIIKVVNDYVKIVESRCEKYKRDLKSRILTSVTLTGNELEDEKIILKEATKISTLLAGIMRSENYLKSFKPVMGRKVIDAYEREEDNGISIIIDGSEVGQFWLRKEYDKKYKK